MNPYSAIVLYLGIWFLTVFVVLPIGLRTQDDEGEVAPGTPASAPANYRFRRMFIKVTIIGTLAWALVVGTIVFSGLSVRDIDFFHRMGPPHG